MKEKRNGRKIAEIEKKLFVRQRELYFQPKKLMKMSQQTINQLIVPIPNLSVKRRKKIFSKKRKMKSV